MKHTEIVKYNEDQQIYKMRLLHALENIQTMILESNSVKDWTIKVSNEKTRSVEISTRFHGWIQHIVKVARERGQDWTYNRVKMACLIEALYIPDSELDGAMSPYPSTIHTVKCRNPITKKVEMNEARIPMSTSNRTNNEMMTACWGVERWAAKQHIFNLPEKEY